MGGWSILTNRSVLDCGKTIGSVQSDDGCCLEVDNDGRGDSVEDSGGYKDELKCLFDKVLESVLKEGDDRNGCVRPIPAMLGNGWSLDLFKLFCAVRERGGFHMVSKNGLWGFVVEELGLDVGVSASVKLIYARYLGELERWLMGSCGSSLGNGGYGCGGNSGLLPLELESRFRGLLMNWPNKRIKDDRLALLEYKKNGNHVDMEIEKSELDLWDTENRHERCNVFGTKYSDNDEEIYGNDDELGNDDPSVSQKEFSYRKRKREPLSGMLNWVIQIAKYPDDPSIGVIPEPSKWKEHGDKELWVQAIRSRDALLQRRHVDSNIQLSLLQNGQKMHPSMYEDVTNQRHRSTERLRCSERLPTIVKSRACSCCSSCSATENKLASPRKTELETGPKREMHMTVSLSAMNTTVSSSGDEPREKHVSVGPLFQANVPEWTGVVLESDPKWLGTRIWSLVDGKHNSLVEMDPSVRGRQDSCGCRLPGSVGCIRFHIAENRMKLKLELGSVFYHWRFDRMGEEVSLRWTVEEEKRFREMVIFSHCLSARFWRSASKRFLGKKREDFVSYYFNVFLVRRRSYQNRVTPRDVDSDDEESEFGSVSDSFGNEAVTVHGSNELTCTQNNQCFDLE